MQQRRRFHLWLDKKKTGEVTYDMVKVHRPLDASFAQLIYSVFAKMKNLLWP
jgi:hypothetical protein